MVAERVLSVESSFKNEESLFSVNCGAKYGVFLLAFKGREDSPSFSSSMIV